MEHEDATVAGVRVLEVVIPGTPPRELSPNARGHWGKKARATAAYREAACWATVHALIGERGGLVPATAGYVMDVVIGWEKGRKQMDPDNAVAVLKAGIDGIADALAINDKRLVVGVVEQTRDPEGRGFVKVVLTPEEQP